MLPKPPWTWQRGGRRGDPLPPEHHDPDEAGFQHEGHGRLVAQHVSEKIAARAGEDAPVSPELKFHGNARGDADGDIEKKEAAPELGMADIFLFSRSYPAEFEKNHEDAEADGRNRPDDVKHDGQRKLQT